MAKLTITRPYQWSKNGPNVHIYIDGEKAGFIGVEDFKVFDLSPQKHKVFVKKNWFVGSKRIEIDLSNNENKTVSISSFKYIVLTYMAVGFLSSILYNSIKNFLNLEINIYLDSLYMLFFYLILFFSFSKSYFWRLEELYLTDEEVKAEQVD